MRQFNTLTGFLLSKSSNPSTDDTVEFQGYAAIGDGGGATWQHNGVTAQPVSQSPAQLADALLNDGNGNQWALVGNITSPKALGVIGDGVIDDTSAYLAAKQFTGDLDMSGIDKMLTTNTGTFTENNPAPKLTGIQDRMMQVSSLDNKFIGGEYVGAAGNVFTVLFGANNGVIAKDMTVESPSFSFLIKPSLVAGGFAQNMLFAHNIVEGSTVNTDVGISIDGDTKNSIVAQNIIKNIQRQDDARPGHAMPVAGNDDDIPVNDCTNLIHALNSIYDIDGTGYHVEDDCSNMVVLANNMEDVEIGIEIINNHVPFNHQYSHNNIQFNEFAIDCTGTGHSDGLGFSFNNFDGQLSTQTTYAVRINQFGTKNINYIGNMHRNFSDKGIQVTAGGAMRIAYNVFDSITGIVLTGTNSATEANKALLIESNNMFSGTGAIFDKTACGSFMGDQNVLSETIDSNIASESVVFIAQRDGVLTGVSRVLETAGGLGVSNATFTISKITSGVPTVLLTNSIPKGGAKYDLFRWGCQHAQVLVNDISRDDIIIIECDGAESAQTLAKIQLEFFYYN